MARGSRESRAVAERNDLQQGLEKSALRGSDLCPCNSGKKYKKCCRKKKQRKKAKNRKK
jgi:uncharacterized protein YchJ